MNYIGIFESLEKIITGILFWFIFIPKTIYKIIVNPRWVYQYIEEQSKKSSDRYINHISPIILFILSSVLLFVFYEYLILTYFKDTAGYAAFNFGYDTSKDVTANINSHKGLMAGIAFLSIPLFFSLVLGLLSKVAITRETLYRLFSVNCYYLTPVSITYFIVLIGTQFDPEDLYLPHFSIALIGSLLWFAFAQTNFIKKELNVKAWKAFVLFLVLFVVVMSGIILLALIVSGEIAVDGAMIFRTAADFVIVFLVFIILRGIYRVIKKPKEKA